LSVMDLNEIPAAKADCGVDALLCDEGTPSALGAETNTETPAQQATAAAKPGKLKKIFRVISTFAAVTVCGLAFGFAIQGFVMSMAIDQIIGSRDFVVFWATGQQLAHHANPYDGVALLRIERAAGLPDKYGAMYMRNLPSALPLVYPLGFLGLKPASITWSLLLFASLILSVRLLWIMHGRQRNSRHYLGYSFGPALVCLIMGQTTMFSLLGLVLFLCMHRTRPFRAGLSLWLCMLKPHLFLPFGLVLLVWIVVHRSYKILAGAALATAVSCALAYLIDPLAWSQYGQMARTSGIQWDFIPCVAVLLRSWISKQSVWIQYVPAALGCIWALWYFWPRRYTWDWNKHGGLMMLVSLVSAPYSWIYDAGLIIPAVLQAAYVSWSRNLLLVIAFLSALIEVALFGNIWKPEAIFLWTMWSAPAWLVWYLVASTPPAKLTGTWLALKGMKWFRASHLVSEPPSQASILE